MTDIRPPWSPDQVTRLNAFQQAGAMHPFTCGNDDCPGVNGQHASLVAAEDGWHCPACPYTQLWAHSFMADGSCERSALADLMAGDAATPPARAESGEPTTWDIAFREGHAHGLALGAGISYQEAFARTVAVLSGEPSPGAGPCCDLHGRNCEPPSELCCENCTEVHHGFWGGTRFGHLPGEVCSNPDLSGSGGTENGDQ